MFLSNLSIKRPIMMTMFIFVFVLFGILAYFKLPMNLMPSVDMPYITIQTIYPGADPQEIEIGVSKIIEEAVVTVPQINEIKSYSMDNLSLIILQFEMNKDGNIAKSEVKDKIDAVLNNLPNGVQRPVVDKFDPSKEPIMQIVLSGDVDPMKLYDLASKTIKDEFSQVKGVAKVDIKGGVEREIQVLMTTKGTYENMYSPYRLSLDLGRANVDMPAGSYILNGQDIAVRMGGKFALVSSIAKMQVNTPVGIKSLSQIAKVKDTSKKVNTRAVYYNNLLKKRDPNVIILGIIKSLEGNPVQVAKDILLELPKIRKNLPRGVVLEILKNDADFIENSVKDTLSTLLLGIIFTGLVLLFFLHDLRSTFIVILAMPTSIIASFMFMNWLGFSLNVLSLMGLATSVGVLVSNSVIVIENIFRHLNKGDDPVGAAQKGTSEVVVAVMAATLTNIVVFLPIGSMNSLAGKFFKEFALTVVIATIFSLLISFTLTPMLASLIISKKTKKGRIATKLENMFDAMDNIYRNILQKILEHKKNAIMVLLGSVILLFTSFYLAKFLGAEFVPSMDQGEINMTVELPQGAELMQTTRAFENIQKIVCKHPQVKYFLSKSGESGFFIQSKSTGNATIKLVDPLERDISTKQMISILSEDLAKIPGVIIQLKTQSGGMGNAIEFYLLGPNKDKLEEYKRKIVEKARDIPGLVNFTNSSKSGKPQIKLSPDRIMLKQVGLDVATLGTMVRGAIEGVVSTQFDDRGNKYDIRVKYFDKDVATLDKIKNIPIVTKIGVLKLSQLAKVDLVVSQDLIIHSNKIVAIQFTGSNSQGVPLSRVVSSINQVIEELHLPAEYSIDWAGDAKEMNATMRDMAMAAGLAIILTYMLLAAILESFIQPLYILVTLPLALIGVILSLIITGLTINIVTMMAIVMLIGIVVNAAILLLDYTNQLKKEGFSAKQALLTACPTKLRPVVMSATAIILGMMPMALGIGKSGVEMRMGMGVVSIGGLIVATFMTLFVVPAIYYLFSRKY